MAKKFSIKRETNFNKRRRVLGLYLTNREIHGIWKREFRCRYNSIRAQFLLVKDDVDFIHRNHFTIINHCRYCIACIYFLVLLPFQISLLSVFSNSLSRLKNFNNYCQYLNLKMRGGIHLGLGIFKIFRSG